MVVGRAWHACAAVVLAVSLMGCSRTAARPGGSTPIAAERAAPAPGGSSVVPQDADSADARIRYYETRLSKNPQLYPLHTRLGWAYLDKARQTHEATWVGKARQAAERSQALQSNFDAMKLMMTVEKYSHRFENAVAWGWRAADASPGGRKQMDPEVLVGLVEAYLGLGQATEAERLLPRSEAGVDRFYVAAAMGRFFAAQGQVDAAVRAFLHARDLAATELAGRSGPGSQGAGAPSTDPQRWALIMAGGVLLDNGRIAEARPHFQAAARAGWTPLLGVHEAEVHEAEGRPAQALASYEKVLTRDPDPEVRRHAFRLARAQGDEKRAGAHFVAAERALRAALEAGEIYTLGALAQLYADAEVRLTEAVSLAKQNLTWKRDAEARETLAQLEKKQAGLRASPDSTPGYR